MRHNGDKNRQAPPDPAVQRNTTTDQSAGSPSNHDARGRFTNGNKAGSGNPYARRVAMLRRAMLRVVQPNDLQAIIVKMILLAGEGDVAAARLVLQYTLGKPTESVDPDTLDLQEVELAKQRLAFKPELPDILDGLPPRVACEVAREMVPGFEKDYRQGYVQMAREREAEEQAAQAAQQPPRPEPCALPPQPGRRQSEETDRSQESPSQPPRPVTRQEQLERLLALLLQLKPEGHSESVENGSRSDGVTGNGRGTARERQIDARSEKSTVNQRFDRCHPEEEAELL
jgi:hypothetical protein